MHCTVSGIQLFTSACKMAIFGLLHGLWGWKHCSTYKLVWKSMNLNRKICIVAHSAIIEYVALLQWNSAVAPLRQHDDFFDLLHGFWAWRHCSIYKLV